MRKSVITLLRHDVMSTDRETERQDEGDRERGPQRGLRWERTNGLVADLVAGHELGDEEGTQHVVLFLSDEAELGSRTLGGVSHLRLRVVRRVAEQLALRQHAGSDGGARIAELRDVRLLGETVHAEIDIGVAARLTVHSLHGVLKFYLLILGHS